MGLEGDCVADLGGATAASGLVLGLRYLIDRPPIRRNGTLHNGQGVDGRLGFRDRLLKANAGSERAYLQQANVAQPGACFMSALVLPFSVAILPTQPVHECE